MAGYSVTFSVVDNATRQIDSINKRIQQMRAPLERQARSMQQFLDVSGLKKVSEGFTQIARTAGEAFSSIGRLVPVMGTLTGAATIGGMVRLVQSWADLGTALQNTAGDIGTTTDNIQRFQNIARLAGANVDDMTQSLIGLSQKLYDAKLGRDPMAVAAFQKIGVAWQDANGNLRNATEVLPEVLAALDKVTDAHDRMRLAEALGGDQLYRLTQEMERAKRPGESLADTWARLNGEAGQFHSSIDPAALQAYREAVGRMEAAFTDLQVAIGNTLSQALTPLIQQFTVWVQTHQPQIIAGIQKIVAALKWLGENMNIVKDIAEGVALFFAAKWAIGIVTSITSIISAIGSAGAITASAAITGAGLLGALGAVAGVGLLIYETYRHWDELKGAFDELARNAEGAFARVLKSWNDFRTGTRTNPAFPAPAPNIPYPGGTAAAPALTSFFGAAGIPGLPGSPSGPTPARAASGRPGPPRPTGEYFAPYGGAPAGGITVGPGAQGPVDKTSFYRAAVARFANSSLAGYVPPDGARFGITTGSAEEWARLATAVGLQESSLQAVPKPEIPGSPDERGRTAGLFQFGADDLKRYGVTGAVTDPNAQLEATARQWEGSIRQAGGISVDEGGNKWGGAAAYFGSLRSGPQWSLDKTLARLPAAQQIATAAGAPAQVTGGAPVSGAVDVTITHKNPPAGSSLTATASGDGVNLVAPRTEYGQLAGI